MQIKANQPVLFETVKQIGNDAKPFDKIHQEQIGQRNRIEIRDITVFDATLILTNSPELLEWSKRIAAVIQVVRHTDCFDTKTSSWVERADTSYYGASHMHSAEDFAQVIRAHWGIENRNHYVRDVTLREDASRIRQNPGIFARLRSFALNIFRKNKITNISEALYDNALCFDNLLALNGVL